MGTLTAADIIKLLIRKRMGRSFVMPNFTPCSWFEAGLWEVSKSGYGSEYEVKVSRGDFFADASKQSWIRVDGKRQTRTKHNELRDRQPRAPSRFFFVAPTGMLSLSEIPEWAGLIEIDRTDRGHVSERLAKAAPKLHGKKVEPSVIERARINAYYRYIRIALARAK